MSIFIKTGLYLMGAAMAFHGAALAQTSAPSLDAMVAVTPQPLDLRVGAVRPGDLPTPTSESHRRMPPPPAASQTVPVLATTKDYRIGPNDLIDVEVIDLDNLKRTVRVNAAGAVSLPLIGSVKIGGMTAPDAEARIAERYREKYLQDPQVAIFIKEYTTERITVEGAVSRPGIFPLTGQLTLLRVLALAGGFGPIANTSEVMLFRVNENQVREIAVYDVEKIRAGKSEDPMIKGDDLVVVQRDSTRRMLKDSLFRDIMDSINPFSILGR
jgi:polysaccharide export outer membrane protein